MCGNSASALSHASQIIGILLYIHFTAGGVQSWVPQVWFLLQTVWSTTHLHSSPQISFLSDMFAPFSTYKPETAIPVYCDFVTCAPGTVPVYYSCCRLYLILKVSWFTMHGQYIFLHILHLYSCQLYINSKNNKCETCDIVLFECMLLNTKLVFHPS